jgi:chromosome segregation protein
MMKLHQLDISGFKSFSDPVRMTFAGGLTAIVGPNGCGKSNISDALTWVLGEQSAKSLRGATMEDVIFNGTAARKPVGMADVTLTLKTDPSFEHAVDGQVHIGRRVFRTGQSEYRLNGKVTRLKQIKDLLMDTGLGIRAYSVIEQGKIGMILSGKPQERRRLLEEAAGITRYKARKRIAEIKLEEAAANLLRLDDIIAEVERALRSLKRQATAARRYQEKEEEYRGLLRQVLLGRWALLRERMGGLDAEIAELTDRDASLTAELHRDEAALAAGREELDALAGELAARHQKQADLAATIEGRQEFLNGARQRLAEIDERVARGHEQGEERRRQTQQLAGSLDNLDERATALVAERDEASRMVAEDDEQIAAAQQEVAAGEARLEGIRRELMGAIAGVNQMRSQLQHEQVEIEKRNLRQRYLDEERTRAERQLAEADATLAAIDETVAACRVRLEASSVERERATAALDALLRREAELSEDRRQLETELAGLGERRRLLAELSEEHAARRRTLIEKLAVLGVAEPRFLADVVSPVEGWEDGIDHFLGELSEAVLVDPYRNGLELARALSRLDAAGAFVRPVATGRMLVDVEDPAIRYSLPVALGLPQELGRALPPAYLVDRAADAARLAEEYPGVAFLSRDRIWAVSGTLRVQGEEAAPGVLARESEREAIEREIPVAEQRRRELDDALGRLVEERRERATAIHRLDDEIGELRREIAVAQARRQDASGRRERLRAQQRTIVEEQEEIVAELAAKEQRKELLARRLAEAEAAHSGATERFDATQREVEDAKARRETLRTAGAGRRGRLELLEERMESQHQEVLRVRQRIEETERQLAAWNAERETLERRQEELREAMDRAEFELQNALERRAVAQDGVLEQQEALDQRRDALRELEGRVQELRGAREELRSQIEEARVRQASLRQDAEHLNATYRDEFKRFLPGTRPPGAPQTDASHESDESDESDTSDEAIVAPAASEILEEDADAMPEMTRARLAELEADLARCKAILERLGPVNVLAAEEYDEQLERETFLKAQRRDVAESVASLRETIREINATSSVRFRETYEQVNKTFGETFAKLFRGGEAEMRLLDEEDLLESGIEIVARPPGKRLQNIMLLSGGEKALTAIALLFALFQSKPSPFCILDEVDAPLDDVNVLRFVDLLQEMAKDTQFLVITHNKLTMEVASTLYGVTMEERGISKLVSVELEDVQPERTRPAPAAAHEEEAAAVAVN